MNGRYAVAIRVVALASGLHAALGSLPPGPGLGPDTDTASLDAVFYDTQSMLFFLLFLFFAKQRAPMAAWVQN